MVAAQAAPAPPNSWKYFTNASRMAENRSSHSPWSSSELVVISHLQMLWEKSEKLLQPKPFIVLGRHLRPLGPHDRRAVRTAKQEPGFAGNVRPHKPGVGLGPEQRGACLDDVRPPGLFRLGRGLHACQALLPHIANAPTHPFHQRLAAAGEVAGPGSWHEEEIREARALDTHIGARPLSKFLLQRLPAGAADLDPRQCPGHGVIARGKDDDVQSVLGIPGFDARGGDA